jgi:hypothetical protein
MLDRQSKQEKTKGSDRYYAQMDKDLMLAEAEGYPIKGVVASRNNRDNNDKMEYTDNEMKK